MRGLFFAYMSARNHVGRGEVDEVMASAMVYEEHTSDDKAKQAPEPGPSIL